MRSEQILSCLWIAAVCFISFPATSAEAVYPTRSIRLIVPMAAGGSSDAVVRLLQPLVERQLGQPLIIDNRTGGRRHRRRRDRQGTA
jgi:tripartite-type tricarboxylate transporter receptor subunit TctC